MKRIILVVIILAIAGAGIYFFMNKEDSTPTPTPPIPAPPDDLPAFDHEDMQDMATTTPPAPGPTTPPSTNPPPPTKDNPDDIDVVPPKVFNLTGKNFSFSQNQIKVKKGDRVVINFTSSDGLHDFVIDEFNVSTDRVNTGETDSVEFIADKTGTFEYYCSVSIHRAAGMKGNLIVE